MYFDRRTVIDELVLVGLIKFGNLYSVRKIKSYRLKDPEKSLKHSLIEPTFLPHPVNYAKNLSSVGLSRLQTDALSVRLIYCIPPRKVASIEIQARSERFSG